MPTLYNLFLHAPYHNCIYMYNEPAPMLFLFPFRLSYSYKNASCKACKAWISPSIRRQK